MLYYFLTSKQIKCKLFNTQKYIARKIKDSQAFSIHESEFL